MGVEVPTFHNEKQFYVKRSAPLQFFSESRGTSFQKNLNCRAEEKKMFYGFYIIFAEMT